MKALILALMPVAATAQEAITTPYDGSFEDATFAVENAIIGKGLVVDHVSHVGEMLDRTRADVGSDTVIFDAADVFLFCSAVTSREVMEADPMNIAHCPYGIFVTDREGEVGIIPPTAGLLGFLNPNALNASGGGSFSGAGNASQQSQLTGTVTVTIAHVYPNGTAEVVGEKQMALSQGDEWVQFAGRIRLVDIDGDNTLPSARVANARIIYTGEGEVQRASRPGWLSRFFNSISPF